VVSPDAVAQGLSVPATAHAFDPWLVRSTGPQTGSLKQNLSFLKP
jgi:hypothetical protein